MAVYTFLEHFDFAGKTIHPFCTHEGSGLSGTVQAIQRAAPGAMVAKGLAIHGSNVGSAKPAVEKWVLKKNEQSVACLLFMVKRQQKYENRDMLSIAWAYPGFIYLILLT